MPLPSVISRFFDATGAGPEPVYIDSDETFRSALTVGRQPPMFEP